MSKHDEHRIPDELQGVVRRLEAERSLATDLELDRMKLKALSRASRATAPRPGRGLLRSGRLASVALAVTLMAGGGAVLAANNAPTTASSSTSSASSQYCPDTSQQPGKPKDPGPSKCGKPKTK
jgi:hypothetical protein